MVLEAHEQGQAPGVEARRIGPALVFERLGEQTGGRPALEALLAQRNLEFSLEPAVFSHRATSTVRSGLGPGGGQRPIPSDSIGLVSSNQRFDRVLLICGPNPIGVAQPPTILAYCGVERCPDSGRRLGNRNWSGPSPALVIHASTRARGSSLVSCVRT
jgi:hypothetical protein